MTGKESKRHYVLIKNFNTFMYDRTLHRGRKHFCYHFLEAFRTLEKFEFHIKDCFRINGKQKIKMPKQANTSDANIMREKESTIYDLCRFGKYSSARR